MAAATEVAGSQSQCMTHAEAQALMETALPGLLQGAKQQCSSVLDSDSYLLKQEATLSKRFRQEVKPTGLRQKPLLNGWVGRLWPIWEMRAKELRLKPWFPISSAKK